MIQVYYFATMWHFTQQDFGVLSKYRSKIATEARRRRFDQTFCYLVVFPGKGVVGVVSLIATSYGMGTLQSAYAVGAIVFGLICLSVVATLLFIVYELRHGTSLPRVLFILSIGICLAFAALSVGFRFLGGPASSPSWVLVTSALPLGIYSINHWLVALALSSQLWPSRRQGMVYIAGVLIVGGLLGSGVTAVFIWPEWVRDSSASWGFHVDMTRVAIIVIAQRLWLSSYHYICDRELYRLRDPVVRAALIAALPRPLSVENE